jgi:ubiquinone/menaquinone biosynthesis C-methylase UbiE
MEDQKVRDYYDSYANGYDSFYEPIQKQKISYLREKFPSSSNIIDIGAGTGILSAELTNPMVSIDISFDMLRNGLDKGRSMLAVCGSVTHLPVRESSFDTIISLTAIHNVSDPIRAFHEIRRIALKPATVLVTILKKSRKLDEITQIIQRDNSTVSSFDVPPEDVCFLFHI